MRLESLIGFASTILQEPILNSVCVVSRKVADRKIWIMSDIKQGLFLRKSHQIESMRFM